MLRLYRSKLSNQRNEYKLQRTPYIPTPEGGGFTAKFGNTPGTGPAGSSACRARWRAPGLETPALGRRPGRVARPTIRVRSAAAADPSETAVAGRSPVGWYSNVTRLVPPPVRATPWRPPLTLGTGRRGPSSTREDQPG